MVVHQTYDAGTDTYPGLCFPFQFFRIDTREDATFHKAIACKYLSNDNICTGVEECEGVGDVVGVVTPLGGVAQVIFHGVKVVEVGVVLRVHQDRGEEEDDEGQVEVEREEGEVKENHTCMTME